MICNPHSNVVITPPKIYGVEWDWTSSGPTKGVRTDDAAGFADPSPAVSNGTGSSPFDNLYPWSEMVREERTGGTSRNRSSGTSGPRRARSSNCRLRTALLRGSMWTR